MSDTGVVRSAAWFEVRQGRLLTVRSGDRDRYFLPGGKPEAGESPEEAMRREVREELGCELREVRLLGEVSAPAHGYPEGTEVRMACFAGRPSGALTAGAEITEVRWLGGYEADLMAPGCRAAWDTACSGAWPGLDDGVWQSGLVRFNVLVEVSARSGIADPQGATVERALPTLGCTNISGVRIGKAIRFAIDAPDEGAASEQVLELCRTFLTNPVIEDAAVSVERAG